MFTNNKGWAVGYFHCNCDYDGTAIIVTLNGGENWDIVWRQTGINNSNGGFYSICGLDRNTGWAAGDEGLLVRCQDGTYWEQQPKITDLPLIKIYFSDSDHGWLSGGYSNEQNFQHIFFKTSDCGATWQIVPGIPYLLKDIYFCDAQHGWAVGTDQNFTGIILRTSDGGNNWFPQIENLSAPLTALHFKDGYGWAVGDNGLVLRTEDGASWINQNTGQIYPYKFIMYQNYPNPFNPNTTIEFSLPNSEFTTLTIYNTLGQQVTTLVSEKLNAGNYKYNWDASGMASGIYYYRLVAGEHVDTKKLIVLK